MKIYKKEGERLIRVEELSRTNPLRLGLRPYESEVVLEFMTGNPEPQEYTLYTEDDNETDDEDNQPAVALEGSIMVKPPSKEDFPISSFNDLDSVITGKITINPTLFTQALTLSDIYFTKDR